jgi:TP901 family phage tail tape measure protein
MSEGAAETKKSIESVSRAYGELAAINASSAITTGKYLGGPAQIAALKTMAGMGDTAAASFVRLAQGQNTFGQVFSGNSKAVLASMSKSGAASAQLAASMSSELRDVQVVSDATKGSLVSLATVPGAKFRIMGDLWISKLHGMSNQLINTGKQAQWVGRQMMVGITLPLLGIAAVITNLTLELNRQTTELQKYMAQAGVSVSEFAQMMDSTLGPAFEALSEQMAIHQADIVQVASLWAAAGFVEEKLNLQLTTLTTQLAAVTQGDLDLASSYELIRSVMSTYNLTIEQTTSELEKLQLIQSETAITYEELGITIPVVSSSAKLLGINVAEVAAMLTGMRQKGVQANQAANALKFGLLRLAAPTDKAAETFAAMAQQMEFSTTSLRDLMYTASGAAKGIPALEEFASLLQVIEKTPGMKAGAAARLLTDVFGVRQVDRMTKLFDAMNDSTSDYNKAMAVSNDAARAHAVFEEQLSIVLNSAAKNWDRLKVSLENAAASLGKIMVPYIQQAFNWIIKIVDGFNNMSDSAKKAILAIAGIAAAIGPLTYLYGQLHLIEGSLLKIVPGLAHLVVGDIVSREDPFGLVALARATKNPKLMVLAGLPAMNQSVAATAGEAMLATNAMTEAIAAQAGAFGTLATAQGGATGTLEAFQAAQLRYQAVMTLGATEAFKSQAAQAVAVQTRTAAGRYAAGWTAAGIEGTFATQAAAKAAIIAAATIPSATSVAAAEVVALEGGMAIGAKEVAQNKGLFTTIGTNIAAGMNTAWDKVKTAATKAFQFLQGPGTITAISKSTQAEGFSKYILQFKSLLPVIAAVGLALLAIGKNWNAIWQGMAPYVTQAIEIIQSAVADLVRNIVSVFSQGDKSIVSTGDAFRKLGSLVGRAVLGMSKAVSGLLRMIGPVLRNVVSAASKGIRLLIDLLTLNGKAFLKDADAAGTITASLVALIVIAKGLKIIQEITMMMKALGTAYVATGSAIKAFTVVAALAKAVKGGDTTATLASVLAERASAVSKNLTAEAATRQALATGSVVVMERAATGAAIANTTANVALASSSKLVTAVSPWLMLATVIGTVIMAFSTFGRHVDEIAEAVSNHVQAISDAFQELAKTITEKADIEEFEQSWTSALSAVGEQLKEIAGVAEVKGPAGPLDLPGVEFAKNIEDVEKWSRLMGQLTDIPIGDFVGNINDKARMALANFVGITEEVQNITDYGTNMNQVFNDFMNSVENGDSLMLAIDSEAKDLLKVLSTADIDQLNMGISDIKDNLALTQASIGPHLVKMFQAMAVGNEKMVQEEYKSVQYTKELVLFYQRLLSLIERSGILFDAEADSFNAQAADFATLAGEVDTDAFKKKGTEEGQAYWDALESELGSLASNVSNVVLEAFDKNAEATLAAFDKSSEARLEAFTATEEKRLGVYDAQIAKIEDVNEREDWLQQQREYRQQREQLIQQGELNSAIAYRERIKAIAEGRYDDAAILEMQAKADYKDNQQSIRDLDQQHTQTLADRRRQKRIDELNKEKDALQEMLDAQRDALQESLDAQKEAMQESIDQERTLLQNRLDEVLKFTPRNKKEWEKQYKDILALGDTYGIQINDVAAIFMADYGRTIQEGFRQARVWAEQAAIRDATAIGASTAEAMRGELANASTPADRKFFTLLSEYASAQAKYAGLHEPMPKALMLSFIQQISAALAGVSKTAIKYAGTAGYGPKAHTGGLIEGSHEEVPIMAQPGEYVFSKKTVKKFGARALERLSKFHIGGMVGGTGYVGGIPNSVVSGEQLYNLAMVPMATLGTAYQLLAPIIGDMTRGMVGTAAKMMGQWALNSLIEQAGTAYAAGMGRGYPAGGPGAPGKIETPYGLITKSLWAFVQQIKNLFPNTSMGGFNYVKYIAGTNIFSQHSYGNAVDLGMSNSEKIRSAIWNWALKNVAPLHMGHLIYKTSIWSDENPTIHAYTGVPHTTHVHADFMPQYGGTPPGYPIGMHGGGVVKFNTPALLHAGETVVPANISKALSKAAGNNSTVNINVDIGHFFGNDESYRQLYSTLEKVGNKISKERGANNMVVKVGNS